MLQTTHTQNNTEWKKNLFLVHSGNVSHALYLPLLHATHIIAIVHYIHDIQQ